MTCDEFRDTLETQDAATVSLATMNRLLDHVEDCLVCEMAVTYPVIGIEYYPKEWQKALCLYEGKKYEWGME